jgi:hypothetical protein
MTFGEIKARISSEMKRGELSASAASVQDSVLSAIKYLERRRFTWNEFADTTATASAGVSYLPFANLPIKPLAIDTATVVLNGQRYMLEERNWKTIESVDSTLTSGNPDCYAIHGRSIRLYPKPSADFALILSGVKQLTEISANASSGATNAWTEDGEELVRLTAKAMLFRDQLRAPEQANYFQGEAAKVQRELQKETAALTSSGALRPRFF